MSKTEKSFDKSTQEVKKTLLEPKTYREILEEQIESGLKEHQRNNTSLFISSISAGLEVGFSVFLMGVIYTLFFETSSEAAIHTALALSYPLGFIFVIIGRSELFTEHTTLAVVPVLNGSTSILSLFQLWGVVLLGNLIGGYFFGFVITIIAPAMGIISYEAFLHLAQKMVEYDWEIILGSAIIAGWLMGLLSWLMNSSKDTISRIFMIILITATIGIGGLHHSVVGSIEVFAGLITSSEITLNEYLQFQLWATLGNMIGGVFFVAVVKFSHVKKSENEIHFQKRESDEK
jgi:formate-nitrite transporter family protein